MPFQTNFSMAKYLFLLISSLGQRFPLFVIQGECKVIGPELIVSHNDFKVCVLKVVKFLLSHYFFLLLDLIWLEILSLNNSFFFSSSVYILCLIRKSRYCHVIIWNCKVLVHRLRLLLWRMNIKLGFIETHWDKLGKQGLCYFLYRNWDCFTQDDQHNLDIWILERENSKEKIHFSMS